MNENFSTQAGNFVSALQTQTDPRTGQFMVNLPIANLVGNNQLGPDLALGLSYSPLTGSNYGFGTGFSLGITRFSNQTNLLELSNGEKYRVVPGTDTVRNQKLSNFRFVYTNGADDADGYTVFWKEGKQEQLTLTGDDTFVTSLIRSPLGRTLTLAWDWSGQYPLLTQVSDEAAVLAQFSYGSTVVSLTVWPETADEYQVSFALINDNQLDTVSRQVSDSETLTWSFSYDSVDGAARLLLTGVDYPTGMTDRVEYSQTDGLQYPDAAGISTRLPAVLSHTRNPGCGQPETVTYYAYTAQNFLGYNGNFGDWAADNDYIYTTLTDYVYGSTETVTDGSVTVTTERTYNNYHLQLSEDTTRDGCTYRTEFAYYAESGTFIDGQPPQFQLPRQKTETWTDAQGNTRTQDMLTEFDESGNPTRQVSPDGTETVTKWYAAAGEDGCPAEPHGFVRFMKSHTVTPRATDYDAPLMQTRYTYTTAGNEAHVVQDTVSSYVDDILLDKRVYTYNTTAGESEYGRITAISNTKYDGGEGADSFVTRQDFATAVSGGVMTQTSTFTGFDGLQAATVREQSVLSGLLLSETNAQNVTVTHTYDRLGRLLTRTLAPGTNYENISTWAYSIEDDGPVTTESDASGNQLRTRFDGAGRSIQVQRLDRDDTQKWYEVSSRTYNALGDVVTGTGSDWLTSSDEQYSVNMTATFDNWGALSTQVFSDSTISLQDTNPLKLTRTVSMQGSQGGKTLSSGSLRTQFDALSQLPLTDTLTDSTGKAQGERNRVWDGLGRLRLETDELGQQTARTYDAYGRVMTQTQDDGSRVTYVYAPHLVGNQVAAISMTGPDAGGNTQTWLLGTQTFDGLGRLTQTIAGGRVTTYAYYGASPAPSSVMQPSGKTLTYTYIPELGNVVGSLTADGITQVFRYDGNTADMLTATESGVVNANTWTPSGSLKTETFTRGDTTRSATYTGTLSGQLMAYTDITGKNTTFERDIHGRVTGITDDVLSVALTYDALGRLRSQAVTDSDMQASVTTSLNYDDFGREITRTVTDSSDVILSVSQTWQLNGLLATRTSQQNAVTVRTEQYGYDSRNRLVSYTVTGTMMPLDAYGQAMTSQSYAYDALNNLTTITTTLGDGSSDKAAYLYENGDDPTQLTSLTHTHSHYPKTITLEYDADGRMIKDEAGRKLNYDATGRLVSVSGDGISGGEYGYDAQNRLVSQNVSDTDSRGLYYRGSELVNEVLMQQNAERRWIKSGHTTLGISTGDQLTLTAGDGNDSLLWSHAGTENTGRAHAWSPYGSGKPEDGLPGFNGERADPVSGTYHLGNGYRAYNPVLMRFNCPDSLSPFGAGGINPYAYCAGDPVNHTDPSGHISWQAITGIVVGSAGLVLSAFTAGASIAAAAGVMAALSTASGAASLVTGVLGVASDATAIASGVVEETNPQTSSILGWVSLATGLASMGTGMATGLYRMSRMRSLNISDKADTNIAAAFKPIRERSQLDRAALNYINDPENFRHTILGRGEVSSVNLHHPLFSSDGSKFINKFTKNEWEFRANFKLPRDPYFASHIAEYQYKLVAKENGFYGKLPKRIIRRSVINRTTLSKTEGLTGSALMQSFLNETPNGKSTQRILDVFGMKARSVERQNLFFSDYPDFIINIG